MSGIYIHIPFCRQACRYCDFFFTVSNRYQDEYVDALVTELEIRAGDSRSEGMDSLYLGGGTPSLLSRPNLVRILNGVERWYQINPGAELTIECNPDDLGKDQLESLYRMGFNRISIGIQSFHDRDLALMRRYHQSKQAYQAVAEAATTGFTNITADLIYGIPGQTGDQWLESLERMLKLPICHLSAYHLTFEPGTVFDHWRKKGKLHPVSEEESISLFTGLRKRLLAEGFEHYEISNFAREGRRSRHNLLYWSGKPYLGFGPSAHSFNGTTRSWNISSLKGYMEGINRGEQVSESEHLSIKEKYHDYLITSMRTSQGADQDHIYRTFGQTFMSHFNKCAATYIENGILIHQGGRITMDPDRWMLADHIVRELFME